MSSGLDFFDTVLLVFLAFVIGVNVILFMTYLAGKLASRSDMHTESHSSSNKADRPFWIAGCMVSGSVWMASTLLLSGNFDIYGGASSYICILLKGLFQYALGYILWTNLIVYRLFRLYMAHAWTKKPLHAMIVLGILEAPFLVYVSASMAMNSSCYPHADYHDYLTCAQGLDWNIALYTLSFCYLLLFIYLALKMQKITGTFVDLKRYIAFCGFSFVFLVFDACMYLSESWMLITVRRLLCLFVFAIVAAQSWTIFWSVLLRKRLRGKGAADDETEGVGVMIADTGRPRVAALEMTDDELLGGPIRRSQTITPSAYSSQHYSARPGLVIPVFPRDECDEPYPTNTSPALFDAQLTQSDRSRLAKGTIIRD